MGTFDCKLGKRVGLCASIQDAHWNAEKWKAICGCFRLLVGAWQAMPARASTSQFLPHNSEASQSLLVSMPIDAHFKEEQIGALSVWVEAMGSS